MNPPQIKMHKSSGLYKQEVIETAAVMIIKTLC